MSTGPVCGWRWAFGCDGARPPLPPWPRRRLPADDDDDEYFGEVLMIVLVVDDAAVQGGLGKDWFSLWVQLLDVVVDDAGWKMNRNQRRPQATPTRCCPPWH